MSDQAALKGFVQGPDGEAWLEKRPTWAQPDVCTWEGVTCNGGEITQIDLRDTELTASIPDGLGSISSLTHLYLGSNSLFGRVPDGVANLPNLLHVDLSMNKLKGTIPVFTSGALEILSLGYNEFSGRLPDNIGNTGGDQLKIFDIKYNAVEGPIPGSIGQLSNTLMELDLSSNKFDGPIPDSLGNMVHLEGLFLSNNELSGSIPPTLTRSNMALSQIFLHGNALSGTLPVALADLPNLKNLFIDDNKLTGSVPNEICALNLNQVFFDSGEEVRGGDSSEKTSDGEGDETVEVEGNTVAVIKEGGEGDNGGGRRRTQEEYSGVRDGCNSVACPKGYFSTGAGKDGVFPCEKCRHDYLNPYIGASSCFILDQFAIMAELFFGTDGDNWDGDHPNWLSKSVTVCNWSGISCNPEGDIVSIVLPNSNLSGKIPPNLGFLRHLEVLDLSDNQITGELPSELHFAPLETLDVSGNMIDGFVPTTLCEKSGINKNGEGGSFSCDNIACAAGTFNANNGRGTCEPCSLTSSVYLASKVCEGAEAPVKTSSGSTRDMGMIASIVGLALLIPMAIFWYLRKRVERSYSGIEQDPSEYSDKDELPEAYISNSMPPPSGEGISGTFAGGPEGAPLSLPIDLGNTGSTWNREPKPQGEVWLDVPKIN